MWRLSYQLTVQGCCVTPSTVILENPADINRTRWDWNVTGMIYGSVNLNKQSQPSKWSSIFHQRPRAPVSNIFSGTSLKQGFPPSHTQLSPSSQHVPTEPDKASVELLSLPG